MGGSAIAAIVALGLASLAGSATAAVFVPLQNATATYAQDGFPAQRTIDGRTAGSRVSWAIFDQDNYDVVPTSGSLAETIVWETTNDLVPSPGEEFAFILHQRENVARAGHALGRFRLSYTTDPRDSFADSVPRRGDVEADWSLIAPRAVVSTDGATFDRLADGSLLRAPGSPSRPVYTVLAEITPAAPITGFRLEALQHPSLPFAGPGLEWSNGNFHLSEFQVSVGAFDLADFDELADFGAGSPPAPVPLPAAAPLFAAACLGLGALAHRRKIAGTRG